MLKTVGRKLLAGFILLIILTAYYVTSNSFVFKSNSNDDESKEIVKYEDMIYKGGIIPIPFPEDNFVITSKFNPGRLHPIFGYIRAHKGTDIAGPTDTEVLAVLPGKVTISSYESGGYGYWVEIDHGDVFNNGNDLKTRYGHLKQVPFVNVGDKVDAGTVIGIQGMTGAATGPHLHFEIRIDGVAVDAEPYLFEGGITSEE